MIRKVFGRRVNFCSEGCRDSFRSDMECGLIYPQFKEKDGTTIDIRKASIKYHFCCYCRADCSGELTRSKKLG